jgi:D-tyrosyl-tRNA(Tyr) deacylase
MKILVQTVSQAKIFIDGNLVSKIGQGLLLLVGIETKDQGQEKKMAEKILKLRIFEDKNIKMNLSVLDINGEILVVPQFTLIADTSVNRPYFGNAANPEISKPIFNHLLLELKKSKLKVESGVFGAKMKVELTNDGPVTIILE